MKRLSLPRTTGSILALCLIFCLALGSAFAADAAQSPQNLTADSKSNDAEALYAEGHEAYEAGS